MSTKLLKRLFASPLELFSSRQILDLDSHLIVSVGILTARYDGIHIVILPRVTMNSINSYFGLHLIISNGPPGWNLCLPFQ